MTQRTRAKVRWYLQGEPTIPGGLVCLGTIAQSTMRATGFAIVQDRYRPELNPIVALEWGWMR